MFAVTVMFIPGSSDALSFGEFETLLKSGAVASERLNVMSVLFDFPDMSNTVIFAYIGPAFAAPAATVTFTQLALMNAPPFLIG